jgi:integrase
MWGKPADLADGGADQVGVAEDGAGHGQGTGHLRGRVAPVRPATSKRVVVDLRAFLDDLAVWGWAQRPPGRLLFPGDVPRLPRPLPQALDPAADRDHIAAVAELDDPFARCGLTILRGTGMRLGELLDLELDCLWDFASHGTWVKVPSASSARGRHSALRLPATRVVTSIPHSQAPIGSLLHYPYFRAGFPRNPCP